MINFKTLSMIGLSIAFVQCQKDDVATEVAGENNELQQTAPTEILENLQKMGFDTGMSPVYANKEGYVVEDDIYLATTDIMLAGEASAKQRYNRNLISCNRSRNIRVRSFLPSGLTGAVRNAIQNWNNVSNSPLNLVLVNSNADIQIRNGSLPRNQFGVANFPSNGRAGREITIDLSRFNGGRRIARIRTSVEHLIGHAIGFRNTDGNAGIAVPGNGGRDGASLMNTQDGTVRNLSNRDKRALRRMYGSGEGARLCR